MYCTLKCTDYIWYDMIVSSPHTNGSFGVCWSVVPCRPQCCADPYHIDDSFPIDPQFGLGWFWTGIILTHIPNHILATFSHIMYLYTYSYSHIMLTYIGLFLVWYWYAMFCLGFKHWGFAVASALPSPLWSPWPRREASTEVQLVGVLYKIRV